MAYSVSKRTMALLQRVGLQPHHFYLDIGSGVMPSADGASRNPAPVNQPKPNLVQNFPLKAEGLANVSYGLDRPSALAEEAGVDAPTPVTDTTIVDLTYEPLDLSRPEFSVAATRPSANFKVRYVWQDGDRPQPLDAR